MPVNYSLLSSFAAGDQCMLQSAFPGVQELALVLLLHSCLLVHIAVERDNPKGIAGAFPSKRCNDTTQILS